MKSAYDLHIKDPSVKTSAPNSAVEELHDDYLVKTKSSNMGEGDIDEKLKQQQVDKTVTVVAPGSARDELLSDYRAQTKNKKWTQHQSNKKVPNKGKQIFNGFKMYLSIVWIIFDELSIGFFEFG